MGEYNNMDAAVAGLKYGLDGQTESWCAKENISFGDAIFGYSGDEQNGYLYHLDTSQTVFDADFVSLNNIVATVNGVAVTAVVFDTDQATTMDNLKAQIEADIAGAVVTLTDTGGANRTIVIHIPGVDVVVTWAVTLGASQAGDTVTVSSAQVFVGVAQLTQKEYSTRKLLDGTEINAAVNYLIGDAMNVLTEGKIYVNGIGAINANTSAYILASGADKGKFTATSTSNYDTKGKFRSTIAASALVLFEVRGQN
jgi:hypothetical protein